MNNYYIILIGFIFLFSIKATAQCPESFHDFSAIDINGDDIDMSDFSGKKILVVNTASLCGYTNQYGKLQELYESYGGDENDYNFEIIGFPANNFFNQEPYDEDYISDVCESYGVTFTMMSKISVKGSDQHEIYSWLTQQSRNCVQDAEVTWNFQKFLINPDGSWHDTKAPGVSPTHSSIVNWITEPTYNIVYSDDKDQFIIHTDNKNKQVHIDIKTEKTNRIEIKVWSITGQLVDEIYFGNINSILSINYNASALHSGIYIIEINGSKIHHHEKIMLF